MNTNNESPAALLPEGRRIAIARDEFFASLSGATLSGAPTGVYLRNRLELAFIEGWKAAKLDASTAPAASESRGSVPAVVRNGMLELRGALEVAPPRCATVSMYKTDARMLLDGLEAMLAAAPTPPAVASGEPTAEHWKTAVYQWALREQQGFILGPAWVEQRARELASSAAEKENT